MTNANATTQNGDSRALTGQANLNGSDVTLGGGTLWLGDGDRSNNGDVTQSNEADTSAEAKNGNDTGQANDQTQSADGGDNSGAGSGNDVSQSQSGTNGNGTTQNADATANTRQANVFAPGVIYCNRCFNGNVTQSNQADTSAESKNSNSTDQSNHQNQSAGNSTLTPTNPTTTIVTETRYITIVQQVPAPKAAVKAAKKLKKSRAHKKRAKSKSKSKRQSFQKCLGC